MGLFDQQNPKDSNNPWEFGSDAVAVATDRPNTALYQGIDAVLKDLVAAPEEDITFMDDPNWDQTGSQHPLQLRNAETHMFPEVGQALKPHSSVEETRKRLSIWHGEIYSEFRGCSGASRIQQTSSLQEPIQLSTCSNLGCWGVGVGRTPDARRATAKVALAAMIALKAAEIGEVPDLSSHPEFSDFVMGPEISPSWLSPASNLKPSKSVVGWCTPKGFDGASHVFKRCSCLGLTG
eukprot:s3942_g2.t1